MRPAPRTKKPATKRKYVRYVITACIDVLADCPEDMAQVAEMVEALRGLGTAGITGVSMIEKSD